MSHDSLSDRLAGGLIESLASCRNLGQINLKRVPGDRIPRRRRLDDLIERNRHSLAADLCLEHDDRGLAVRSEASQISDSCLVGTLECC